MRQGNLNQYQRAILSLGEILEKYNNNGIIPCYGFGAKIDGNRNTNFEFPLNLNFEAPFCKNYGEMFHSYQNIFSRISLSGPTNFAPLIRAIINYTIQNKTINELNYTVYIILTDGAITDINETIREVVNASGLPMSIIIVGKNFFYINNILGVGKANFSNMVLLDSDDRLLKDEFGNVAQRDIVQFVPFEEFGRDPFRLREEVLQELPDQVVQYYLSRGIKPAKGINF